MSRGRGLSRFLIEFLRPIGHVQVRSTPMSNHTSLKGSVALVTGANRGIGSAFVSGLLEAGAERVYAAARDPQTLTALAQSNARVVPITLDITDDRSVQEAAARL